LGHYFARRWTSLHDTVTDVVLWSMAELGNAGISRGAEFPHSEGAELAALGLGVIDLEGFANTETPASVALGVHNVSVSAIRINILTECNARIVRFKVAVKRAYRSGRDCPEENTDENNQFHGG